MHLMNLTPHDIVLVKLNQATGEYDELFRLPKSPLPARVEMSESLVGEAGGVEVYQANFGDVTNVPSANGVGYIVSRLVAERLPERHDLLIPHKTVRDANGKIVGCRAFARL